MTDEKDQSKEPSSYSPEQVARGRRLLEAARENERRRLSGEEYLDHRAQYRSVENPVDYTHFMGLARQPSALVGAWVRGLRPTSMLEADLSDFREASEGWSLDLMKPFNTVEMAMSTRETLRRNNEFADAVSGLLATWRATHDGEEPPVNERLEIVRKAIDTHLDESQSLLIRWGLLSL